MRQEQVTLQDVDISQVYDEMKKYLKNLKLDIIHEEKEEKLLGFNGTQGTLEHNYYCRYCTKSKFEIDSFWSWWLIC
jgi:hypothetical protein